MTRCEGIIYCDGCGVEITWAPILNQENPKIRQEFCCTTCLQGIPCNCNDRMELDSDRRSQPNIQIEY